MACKKLQLGTEQQRMLQAVRLAHTRPARVAQVAALVTAVAAASTATAAIAAAAVWTVRVRFHIIRNARIENVGESQSCMVSKVRIIWKQTVLSLQPEPEPERGAHGRVGRGELLSFYCGRCAHHAQFWFDATALAMSQAEMWQCVAPPALRAD